MLTNAVAVGVGREAGDALGLGAADEGAHFVFTQRAWAAVVGLQSAFVNVCKETQARAVSGWNATVSDCRTAAGPRLYRCSRGRCASRTA